MLTRIEEYNPLRPLNWRWRAACKVVAQGGRLSRADRADASLAGAVQLRRAISRCRTTQDFDKIAHRMPQACAAHQLWLEAGPKTWEIEARLLARQTNGFMRVEFLIQDDRTGRLSTEFVRLFDGARPDPRPPRRLDHVCPPDCVTIRISASDR